MPFKRFTTFVLTILVLQVHGQKDSESYYLFDSAWKGTTVVAEAKYFARVKPAADSADQWDVYRLHGPLIRIETNKNDGTAHGPNSWYDAKGYIDSLGHYTNGIRNGDWYYYDDTGSVTHLKRYVDGQLVFEKDYTKLPPRKDEPLKEGEAESMFKGGIPGWQRYLNKNLRYPKEAIDREIQGDVRVRFIVDVDGTVYDPWIEKSVELSLDDESMRLIIVSPKWQPGMQAGKKVKTYKLQPFFYRLQ
jgi:periplasmic protein TonB